MTFFGFPAIDWVVANLCASAFMTGVIWFVQIVHYPLFARVGAAEFAAYERRHANRTGLVVAPVMIFELGAASGLAYFLRSTPNAMLAYAALGLAVVIWMATFAVQVPCHNRLAEGFDARVHRRLVLTNWIRTIGWTGRSVLLVLLLLRVG